MSESNLRQVDYVKTDSGYEAVEGSPLASDAPAIDYENLGEDIRARLIEANDTFEVISGNDKRPYETFVFNPSMLSRRRILKPSTTFSSGLKNPANLLETALAAALNPDAAYIYLGNFGNHPTGHMGRADLRYVRHTGRYTTGDGSDKRPYSPLASVYDMAETLDAHGLAPTHLSADAEAGRLALGLMAAFDRNTIEGAYLNGIDGISPAASYVRARLMEDWTSRLNRRRTEDARPGELTPGNIKEVKRSMPRVYHGIGYVAHLAPLPLLFFPRDVRDKLWVSSGFRGHSDLGNLSDHAVYHDTRAALTAQDTTITGQFNTESSQHNIEDCVLFGRIVMDSLAPGQQTANRRIRLLIGEGSFDQHTDSPHDRVQNEREALPGLGERFLAIAGNAGRLLRETDVFDLPAVA